MGNHLFAVVLIGCLVLWLIAGCTQLEGKSVLYDCMADLEKRAAVLQICIGEK